jgi:uncharacterized protein
MTFTSPSLLARALALLVRGYQVALSPWFGNQCRFHPTCSEYSRQALLTRGATVGSYLTLRRLCKCHPWHPGGIDEVPSASSAPRQRLFG